MTTPGQLYIVATPIGNLSDITLRALKVLAEVECVAAEDTRHTARLLSHHGLTTRLISCHEHNEAERIPMIVDLLARGLSVALVSDAGTPLVSDPGYRLIQAVLENDLPVVPVPGPSAALTALMAAGFPTDVFTFAGFPPKRAGKRRALLERLALLPHTLIFYESPRRILDFVTEAIAVMGDRDAALAREMTKLHEEFIRGPLTRIRESLAARPEVKGECTLLIRGDVPEEDASSDTYIDALKAALLTPDARISEISRDIARRFNLPRKTVYAEALAIKERNPSP